MRTNVKKKIVLTEQTHEGAPAYGNLTPLKQLRRSVLSCFLWENEFYEDGQSIADRITATAKKVKPQDLANLAIEARTKFHLRHVPLLLLTILAQTGSGTRILSETIPKVVKRADELTELLALYWGGKKKPLSAQLKKGLAKAFTNFDEHQLAKYNRDNVIKLRDVMFLVCPKPKDKAQAKVFKRLAEDKLETPDTWEVSLSAGKDKKKTFERLLKEEKLGGLAILRNMRNMADADVDKALIKNALFNGNFNRVLPFRYVAAARACPQFEPMIDGALLRKIEELPPLPGKTVVLVDVSGSMDEKLSGKSDMTRVDAAATLASIIKSDSLRVFSFSNNVVEVAPRRGMSGVDAVVKSQPHGGTRLGEALEVLNKTVSYDRIIVITDEQSHDQVNAPKGKGYMINVGSYKNGVGYGPWTHIDGFSERVFDFMRENEDL